MQSPSRKPKSTSRYPIPNQLLLDFLNHVSYAAEEFPKVARPFLLAVARRRAPDLPVDLRQDIVSETFALLLMIPESAFNPAIGPAKSFLALQVRSAIRRVRADYCPPGQRTRPLTRTPTVAEDDRPRVVPIDDLPPREEPRNRYVVQQFDACCDAKTLLAKAPPSVAVALHRIHIMGEGLSEVSGALGVSRFAMARAITAFSDQIRQMV